MRWISVLVPVCFVLPLAADEPLDLSVVMNRMTHENFPVRQAAVSRLVEVAETNFDEVVRALFKEEESQDPEMAHRVDLTLMRLFEVRVLGASETDIGVEWGWHLQAYYEGAITARPIAEKVRKGSAAAKAGIKPGDVLIHVNGTPLPRLDGIAEFRRILREAEPGQELKLKLRSSKLLGRKSTTELKPPRELSLKMDAGHLGGKPTRKAEKGEFEKWRDEQRIRLGKR